MYAFILQLHTVRQFLILMQPLLYAKFYHLPEQLPGRGFAVGQMQGAFGVGQLAETVNEGVDGRLPRMEAHVLLLGGEVNKVTFQHKGRHTLCDFFAYFRMISADQCAQRNHSLFQRSVISRNEFINCLHRTLV